MSTSRSYGQPVFPPELQHLIVKLALQDIGFPLAEDKCCRNLQLTSRAFREWTMPCVFRVLDSSFLLAHFQNPDSELLETLKKFGKHTTHLSFCLPQDNEREYMWELIDVLKLCPNIEDLLLFQDYDYSYEFAPLTLWSIDEIAESLPKLKRFTGVVENNPDVDLFYDQITHLCLLGMIDEDTLADFSNLTHISIYMDALAVPVDWVDNVKRLMHPDMGIQSLRVIVAMGEDDAIMDVTEHLHEEAKRYIVLREPEVDIERLESNWLIGINGGMDIWEFGERMAIARQKSYLVDDSIEMIDRENYDISERLTEDGQVWWEARNQELNIG